MYSSENEKDLYALLLFKNRDKIKLECKPERFSMHLELFKISIATSISTKNNDKTENQKYNYHTDEPDTARCTIAARKISSILLAARDFIDFPVMNLKSQTLQLTYKN